MKVAAAVLVAIALIVIVTLLLKPHFEPCC